MSAIFILLGASLLIAGGFLGAYLWSVKTGQYEDTYSFSYRILFDTERETPMRDSILPKGEEPISPEKRA